ncbi:hypothetical protein JCM5353_003643 [Sporobolomyces roseus]
MSSAVSTSFGAASRGLYRSLLRVANKMPDDHRRALVVFRARSEFDKSRSLEVLDEIRERQLEGEIYRDQLEHQAEHLQSLARSANLIIPVDIRSPPASHDSLPTSSSPTTSQPTRPSRPSRPLRPSRSPASHPSPDRSTPAPALQPLPPPDRRKLLRAIQSRKEGIVRGRSGRNRFMEGPEPSWVVKKREQGRDTKVTEKHEEGCGCGGH